MPAGTSAALELCPPVPGTLRRLRIDANSVIVGRTQRGNEAAERPHPISATVAGAAGSWAPPNGQTAASGQARVGVSSGLQCLPEPQIRSATHYGSGAAATSASALILLSVTRMPRLTWRLLGTRSSVRRPTAGHHKNR
jgi:hypothetical protein